MELRDLQRNWDELGERDALWAICTHPDKLGGKWSTEEFFDSGTEHVRELVEQLDGLGALGARQRVLDFGCGVGRLTQAFADVYDEAYGVDIAPSMIDRARQLNRQGDRCRYFQNSASDLLLFDDGLFDLVFSVIVLQHMAPELAVGYIREFFRVAAPGGTVVFQVPSHILREALPDDAYRAELVAKIPRQPLPAGRKIDMRVAVRNAGTAMWPAGDAAALRLGNHWLDEGGATIRLDDGRCELPRDVAPGATIEIPLEVTTPGRSGSYILELDVVQEGITWFADAGSTPARYRLDIEETSQRAIGHPEHGAASVPTIDDEPVMEMHAVPRDEVVSVIAASGGEIVTVEENQYAPPWESFTYIARKR